jgi:hypothetical protein
MNKIKKYIAGTLVTVALGAGMLMLPREKEKPRFSITYAGFNEQTRRHEVDVYDRDRSRYTRLHFNYEGQLMDSLDIDVCETGIRHRLERQPPLESVVKNFVDVPPGPYADMLEQAKQVRQEH